MLLVLAAALAGQGRLLTPSAVVTMVALGGSGREAVVQAPTAYCGAAG